MIFVEFPKHLKAKNIAIIVNEIINKNNSIKDYDYRSWSLAILKSHKLDKHSEEHFLD